MQSWWWGGGIFLGGMIVMVTPILNILFCLAMTAAWAVAGFHIGEAIGKKVPTMSSPSLRDSYLLALI